MRVDIARRCVARATEPGGGWLASVDETLVPGGRVRRQARQAAAHRDRRWSAAAGASVCHCQGLTMTAGADGQQGTGRRIRIDRAPCPRERVLPHPHLEESVAVSRRGRARRRGRSVISKTERIARSRCATACWPGDVLEQAAGVRRPPRRRHARAVIARRDRRARCSAIGRPTTDPDRQRAPRAEPVRCGAVGQTGLVVDARVR